MPLNTKIFIIGLPRTGTTSLCLAMLELGYRVAHTAYTADSMSFAEVIADTPVFCDYQQLAVQYPTAKFIYLERALDAWLPSIKQLLQRMYVNLTRPDGGFNPTLKRCYQTVFEPLTEQNIEQDEFLRQCYYRHQAQVKCFFMSQSERLLRIELSEPSSCTRLTNFLGSHVKLTSFARVNIGGKVTYWNSVKHPLKIAASFKHRY